MVPDFDFGSLGASFGDIVEACQSKYKSEIKKSLDMFDKNCEELLQALALIE